MQITAITSQYLACEYQRTQSCIMPHLLSLQTEASVWTTSFSAFLQWGFTTSEEKNYTPPPPKQKLGNCLNCLLRHKLVGFHWQRASECSRFAWQTWSSKMTRSLHQSGGQSAPPTTPGREGRAGPPRRGALRCCVILRVSRCQRLTGVEGARRKGLTHMNMNHDSSPIFETAHRRFSILTP